MSYRGSIWEEEHYRFGLAGQGQADIIAGFLDQQRGVVLSAGCGPWGDKARRLSQHATHLIALDKAAECVRMLKTEVAAAGASARVSCVQADVHAMPFHDEAVDHVVALGLFAYVVDTAAVLAELKRVCRREGIIAITNSVARDPEKFRRAASDVDLRVLRESIGYCPAASGPVKQRHLLVLGR